LTFGDISVYDWWTGYLPIDGALGLAPSPSANGIPNALQQLVSHLSQPLVVLNTQRDFEAAMLNKDDPSEANSITFGTDAADGCGSTWNWVAGANVANNTRWATLNTTSFSIEAGADGCQSVVSASHQLWIRNYFSRLYVSFQVQELLVQANGAVYNTTSDEYEVPCDQIAQGRNVIVGLENGGSITLTPSDVIVKIKNHCQLYVGAWYDEHDNSNNQYGMVLGQQFLNNHCVAYNIADNLVGISDKPSSSA